MILNTERQDGGQQLKKKEEEENDYINGANGAVAILLLDISFSAFNKHVIGPSRCMGKYYCV